MNFIPICNFDSIYSPKLDYLVITFIIIIIGQVLEKNLAKGKRDRIASLQRETYYTRLKEEAAKMDEKASIKEQELSNIIEQLEHERENLQSQLSDCSQNYSDEDLEDKDDTSENSFDNQMKQQKQELSDLQNRANELELVEKSIVNLSQDAKLKEDEKLENKIAQLEAENEQLKSQIQDFKTNQLNSSLLIKNTKLDQNILDYIEDHKEDLTLDFLKTAQETLLEMKVLHPDINFNDYIKKLKNSQVNYNSALADLQVNQKESEIKFQLLKKRYEEELSSFDELRVEHIFKNSGAKEYLDRLKDKNKIKEDMLKDLKNELYQRKNEIAKWQKKFQEAEEQCNTYWKAWKDTSTKLEKLELENKASRERDRHLMSIGSPDHLSDGQVPPPPPIEVPSIDEILESNANQNSHYSLQGSISPPPQVDVPFSSFNYN